MIATNLATNRVRFIRSASMALAVGALGLSGALGLVGCQDVKSHAAKQKPEDLTDAVAKIDDVVITVGEFQDRINQQSPYVRARYTSIERKKEFLDNLVRFEVLAKEAERRGLQKDPEVVRTMKQVMIQRLLKDEFDKFKPEDITDAECKQYYDAHPEEYNQPEQVRVSMILVKDGATAKKVMADPRIKGVDNQNFRALVTEYSQDQPTKERAGDLRYFDQKTNEVPKEIVEASFKLQNIGDVTPQAVKTAQGLAILKLTGRRRAMVKTLDESKQGIRNRLWRDKRQTAMEDFVKKLREKASVTVDESKLSKVQIEGAAPGAFPGPGVPPPGPGGFQPGAPGVPQAGPAQPGHPGAAGQVTAPPQGSPVAPAPGAPGAPPPGAPGAPPPGAPGAPPPGAPHQ